MFRCPRKRGNFIILVINAALQTFEMVEGEVGLVNLRAKFEGLRKNTDDLIGGAITDETLIIAVASDVVRAGDVWTSSLTRWHRRYSRQSKA